MTVQDTLLAVFSSDCVLLAIDDDSGEGVNSRIRINVPADGILIIAATSYADFGLTGQGYSSGEYRLRVRQEAGSTLLGRVVNSRTGAPVPFPYLTLYRCFEGFCFEFVTQTYGNADGSFLFTGGGGFLFEGDYRLVVQANNYETREERFHLASGQTLDLGDVSLDPIPMVSSIRGRLVDAGTGEPLPGNTEPFAFVQLLFCPEEYYFYCFPVRGAATDSQGNFLFAGGTEFFPLFAGTYQIRTYANQYLTFESERFTVEDGEDHDTGDLAIKSFPVRIHLVQPCDSIPSQGGNCRFTVKVTNGMDSHLAGEAWSVVQASGLATPTGTTIFQTGVSKAVSLPPGGSIVLPFTFFVPGEVSDGTYICARGLAASRPHSFNTLGDNYLFCLVKGGGFFRTIPGHEKRDAVRRSQGEGPRNN
ncbi:MAG: collagen binding domain-containing protein [Thermoanaerobaculia bacterium]